MHSMHMTDEEKEQQHRHLLIGAVESERRRLIGIVLNRYALVRQNGKHELAQYLDDLATEMENS